MFALLINQNTALDLPPEKPELRLVLKSGIVDEPSLPIGYSIDLPPTDKNRRLFEFIEQPASSLLEFVNENTMLVVAGMPWLVGRLEVTGWGTSSFKATFYPEVARYIDAFEKEISSLLGVINFKTRQESYDYMRNAASATWQHGACFPEFYAPNWFDSSELFVDKAQKKWVNMWWPSEGRPAVDVVSTKAMHTHVPMFFLKYILHQAATNAGFNFGGAFWDSEILENLIVFNNYIFDDIFVNQAALGLFTAAPGLSIIAARHVPQVQFKTLVKSIMKLFCLHYVWDEVSDTFEIRFKKDTLASSDVIDYSKKMKYGYEGSRQTDKANMGIRYSDNIFEPYSPAKVRNWIDIDASTLTCAEPPDLSEPARVLPIYNETAAGAPAWQVATKCDDKLRLLFYHGLRDTNGKTYPRAFHTDKLDASGQSLAITGTPLGLYEQVYKDFIAFLDNTKQARVTLLFNAADLLEFDVNRKIRLFDVVYIVDSADITLTDDAVYEVDLTLYTVPSTFSNPCQKTLRVKVEKEECKRDLIVKVEPTAAA
jgi:hypothetical protein